MPQLNEMSWLISSFKISILFAFIFFYMGFLYSLENYSNKNLNFFFFKMLI